MKFYRLLYILLIFLCPALKAQEPFLVLDPLPPAAEHLSSPSQPMQETGQKGSKWQFGVTAGYLHSTVQWVEAGTDIAYTAKDHIRSHPGFTAGVTASYPFAEVWSVDTGANLSLWGFGYQGSDISLRADRYVLEIPVVITFFESDAYLPVFIQAGLVGGITISGIHNIIVSDPSKSWKGRRTADSFNRLSLGMVLGVGYRGFTFQFIKNFTNVWNRPMSISWEEYTGRTLTLQTSLAYSLAYTYWF